MKILIQKKSDPHWFLISRMDLIDDITTLKDEAGCDILLRKNMYYNIPEEDIRAMLPTASRKGAEEIKEIEYVIILCDL